MLSREFLWTESHRPQKVADCILPDRIKSQFQSYVDAKNMPNLILTGSPGLGKTSVAIATLIEMDVDFIKINSSLEKGLDTIRDKVMNFASTVSFSEGRKYVVFDEADGMMNTSLDALKAFLEEYAMNCGFIFTCNNLSKIIAPIQDRCDLIDFTVSADEINALSGKFNARLTDILNEEGVTFDKKVIKQVIMLRRPSWRKVLVVLQNYAIKNNNVIDSGILSNVKSEHIEPLVLILKGKRFTEMRQWVGENASIVADFTVFANQLHKIMEPLIDIGSLSTLFLSINEYDYRNYFVNDKETNVVSFLTNVMKDTVWKAQS